MNCNQGKWRIELPFAKGENCPKQFSNKSQDGKPVSSATSNKYFHKLTLGLLVRWIMMVVCVVHINTQSINIQKSSIIEEKSESNKNNSRASILFFHKCNLFNIPNIKCMAIFELNEVFNTNVQFIMKDILDGYNLSTRLV